MKYNTLSFRGHKRQLFVNWVWRRNKSDMERAYATMTRQTFDDDAVGLIGCVSKAKGKDVFYVGLSGVGHNLIDTIIHEACHVGQIVSKDKEVSAELTARLASAIMYILRKDERCKLP